MQEAPKFDPKKKYTWPSDVQFTMNGGEFGLLLNALRAVTGTKEAQTILIAHDAGNVLENLLASAVEKGIVVEVPQQ
jgi:hypothetical protein